MNAPNQPQVVQRPLFNDNGFSAPLANVVERIRTDALSTSRRPRYDTDELSRIRTTTGRVFRELRDLRADLEAKDQRLADLDNRLAELAKAHVRTRDELADTQRSLRAAVGGETG
jgi:chromosome segregation ATPase